MAEITRTVNGASLATTLPPSSCFLSNLFAGMTLSSYDACYINGSDGLVYQSNGTAVNAAAKVRGYASRKYSTGDPVTLMHGIEVQYADASGMTPGADLFLSASVSGGLATVATTGGTSPVGFAVTDQRAFLKQSSY